MSSIGQLLLAMLIVSLSFGPFSHYIGIEHGAPNLVALTIWAFSWFADRGVSFRFAVIIGVIFDLISFLPFGVWTAVFVGLTALSVNLKERFFEVVSMVQAILLLAIVGAVLELIQAVLSSQFYGSLILVNIAYTLILGCTVYYVIVVRFRLLQRWLGRRI